MKDIDFDELDRAVSSVLGQQSPKQDDTDTNAVQTVAPQEPTASAESSSAEAVAPVEVSSEQAPASTTPLAVKRRGKFMDVMHPSADMSSSTAQATSTRPTRTSPVLQPLSSDVAPEMPAQDTPVAPAETEVIEPTAELDESHALIGAEPAPVENLLPEHAGEDDVSHDAAAVSEKETSGVETSAVESEAPVETTVDTEDKSETDDVEPVKSLYVDPLELAGSDEQPKEEAAQTPAVVAQAQPTEIGRAHV